MKKIGKTTNQIIFSTEIEDSLANAIRRYVHQVPMIAVEDVEISRNDSPLYDETVAHRIGLIPLKAEKAINDKTSGKLSLEIKKEGIVYSGDFKGDFKVVYDKIPLTTLAKGQELKLTANVKSGTGAEHSKFTPGLMFYRHATELTLDKSLYDEIRNACPDSEIKEKGDKIIIADNSRKEVTDVCESIAHKQKKKVESKATGDVIVTVESFGQISSEEVLKRSVHALRKDLDAFSKALSKA